MRARALVAATVVALALASCGGDDDDAVRADLGRLSGRTFLSTEVTGRRLVDGTRIRLEFDDGRLGAHAGCNSLGGAYSGDDGVLVVGDLDTTEIGCDPARHEQDEWLARFLVSRPTWELAGDRLTLVSGAERIVALDREVADPDRPLQGTRWELDSLVDGEMASSAGPPAHLRVDDGRVTGNGGCDDFEGTAEVEGDRIRFEVERTTANECPPGASEQDEFVLAVLSGDVRFEIVAVSLTLTAGDRQLVLRAA